MKRKNEYYDIVYGMSVRTLSATNLYWQSPPQFFSHIMYNHVGENLGRSLGTRLHAYTNTIRESCKNTYHIQKGHFWQSPEGETEENEA